MRQFKAKYRYLPPIVYPITIITGIALFYALKNAQYNILINTYLPILIGVMVITFLELYIPHKKHWIANKKDVFNDSLFLVTVQMILPEILAFLVALSLLNLLNFYGWQLNYLWPHHWNIGIQTILMVLIADFFIYWLHRFSHINGTLWKIHAVHHSPKKLYWLNVGRFHPIEKSLQFLFDALPFILVGISEEVLALYFVFYSINGFFQHCNIELRMGLLNFIISGPQLHRWHHSRSIEESNANYGNNIIIWDLVFGTFYFPKDRLVNELGMLNESYPLDYMSQMTAPFSGEIDKINLPVQNISDIIINRLLKIKMFLIKQKLYLPIVKNAEDPAGIQNELMLSIINKNKNTEFGKTHNFSEIKDYETFKSNIPISDYENLRDYIERQENEKIPILTTTLPIMYNQTSGTTGTPKLIPVLKETLESLKKTQQVFSYVQHKACPGAFSGKILGMVSPAIEGYLKSGTAYGSASGHIYQTMPKIAKMKYVLPVEVFEIENYEFKYYIISRLAIEQKNITYLGSANPSTFHKILEVINTNYEDIINDILNGTCKYLDEIDNRIALTIRKKLKPNKRRFNELNALVRDKLNISYSDIWPYIKLLLTWTGGSCGISLKSILNKFPQETKVIDLGYLSSEVRGSVTVNPETNGGIPTIQENFFEFVLKEDWEMEKNNFKTVNELEHEKEYYLFVTTPTGLYRYNMNDIIYVTGKFSNTPTFKFLQKGKCVTNITGEKLYEKQIIKAISYAELKLNLSIRFYQMLANEHDSRYELYIELTSNAILDIDMINSFIDELIQNENCEYKEKRSSNRLKNIQVYQLNQGAFELYKQHYLGKGQRESQFKPFILQYKKDLSFNISKHCIK